MVGDTDGPELQEDLITSEAETSLEDKQDNEKIDEKLADDVSPYISQFQRFVKNIFNL